MKAFDYRGGYRYHVVVLTRERKSIFSSDVWARAAVDGLERSAMATAFETLAYCVMPNHIHLLLEGRAEADSDLKAFVHHYKQALGYRYRQETGEHLWHRSYYDHVLRPDEPAEAHATYIIGNPVAAGLVDTIDQWPYSGPPHMLPLVTAADRSKDLSLRVARIAETTQHALRGLLP